MCKSGSVDKLGWLQNRVLLEERYCMGETERRKQFDHQKTVCFKCSSLYIEETDWKWYNIARSHFMHKGDSNERTRGKKDISYT